MPEGLEALSKVFLGDVESTATASQLKRAKWFGVIVWLLLIVSLFAILWAKLRWQYRAAGWEVADFGQSHTPSATEPKPAAPVSAGVSPLIVFSVGVFFTLVHGAYLVLVLRMLIFGVPPERLRFPALYIPTLLGAAYICTGLADFLTMGQPDHYALGVFIYKLSVILFACVYAVWVARDYCEAKLMTGIFRVQRLYWLAVDIAIVAVWVGHLFNFSDRVHDFNQYTLLLNITTKDVIVLFCLVAYLVIRATYRVAQHDFYPCTYSSYMRLIINRQLPEREITNLAQAFSSHWSNRAAINVIDFGSGDSSRLVWFLNKFAPAASLTFDITRYDLIRRWRRLGAIETGRCAKLNAECTLNFTDEVRKVVSAAHRTDLVHVSHALYDASAAKDLKAIAKACPSGTLFAVRGIGKSIFRDVSYFQSEASTPTNIAHMWDSNLVQDVSIAAGLEPFPTKDSNELLLRQDLPRSEVCREVLENFFEILYGTSWSERSRHYLDTLFRYGPGTVLVNDDKIVFLRKK